MASVRGTPDDWKLGITLQQHLEESREPSCAANDNNEQLSQGCGKHFAIVTNLYHWFLIVDTCKKVKELSSRIGAI
jgi:hypothetical protein